jgi:oligopeptidase B
VTDYLEFGNPIIDEMAYKLISSFSPYENLANKEYPSTYINLSLNDPRVPSWGGLKFIERMRDMALNPTRFPDFGDKNIVVKLNRDEGHFGSHDND